LNIVCKNLKTEVKHLFLFLQTQQQHWRWRWAALKIFKIFPVLRMCEWKSFKRNIFSLLRGQLAILGNKNKTILKINLLCDFLIRSNNSSSKLIRQVFTNTGVVWKDYCWNKRFALTSTTIFLWTTPKYLENFHNNKKYLRDCANY